MGTMAWVALLATAASAAASVCSDTRPDCAIIAAGITGCAGLEGSCPTVCAPKCVNRNINRNITAEPLAVQARSRRQCRQLTITIVSAYSTESHNLDRDVDPYVLLSAMIGVDENLQPTQWNDQTPYCTVGRSSNRCTYSSGNTFDLRCHTEMPGSQWLRTEIWDRDSVGSNDRLSSGGNHYITDLSAGTHTKTCGRTSSFEYRISWGPGEFATRAPTPPPPPTICSQWDILGECAFNGRPGNAWCRDSANLNRCPVSCGRCTYAPTFPPTNPPPPPAPLECGEPRTWAGRAYPGTTQGHILSYFDPWMVPFVAPESGIFTFDNCDTRTNMGTMLNVWPQGHDYSDPTAPQMIQTNEDTCGEDGLHERFSYELTAGEEVLVQSLFLYDLNVQPTGIMTLAVACPSDVPPTSPPTSPPASPPTAAAPTTSAPNTAAPATSSGPLSVSSGASFCQIDANGCATDGAGDHDNNEACIIQVTANGFLTATQFDTEVSWDYVTIGGVIYQGSTGPNGVAVSAGSSFEWRSDGSVTNDGWTICWTAAAPPTSPPTPPPTPPPTRPTNPPTGPPTSPPTDRPTPPPTDPPTRPPSAPPTSPPTRRPTPPPTRTGPTPPPTPEPSNGPTDRVTGPPTNPPTDPPINPPTNPPTTTAPTPAPATSRPTESGETFAPTATPAGSEPTGSPTTLQPTMPVPVPTPAPTTGSPTFTSGVIPAISVQFGPASQGMDAASQVELCAGTLADVNRVGAMALSMDTVGCEVSSAGVVTTRFCAESGISMAMADRLASMVARQPITVALAGSLSAPATSVTTTGAVSFGVDTCVPTPAGTTTTTTSVGNNGGALTSTTTTLAGALAITNDNNEAASASSTAWLWILVVMLLLGVVLAMLFLWRRRQKENDRVFGSLQASKRESMRTGSTATYSNRTFALDGDSAAYSAGDSSGLYGSDNYLDVGASTGDGTAASAATGASIAGFSNPLYPDHPIPTTPTAAAAAPASGGGGGTTAIGSPESNYGGDVYAVPMAGGQGEVYAVVPISGASMTVYNTALGFQESYVDRNAAVTSHHVALPQSAYDEDPEAVTYSEADDATDRETAQRSYDAVEPYDTTVPARGDEQTGHDTVVYTPTAMAPPAAVAGPAPTYGGGGDVSVVPLDVYAVPLEGGGVAAIYGDATEVGDYASEAYSQPADTYAAPAPAQMGSVSSGGRSTYSVAVDGTEFVTHCTDV